MCNKVKATDVIGKSKCNCEPLLLKGWLDLCRMCNSIKNVLNLKLLLIYLGSEDYIMPENALWNIVLTALIEDSLNKDFLLNIRCLNLEHPSTLTFFSHSNAM